MENESDMEKNLMNLLKKSGYSDKAINYYINRVNFGPMDNSNVSYVYTGSCGDTMEIFLRTKSGKIVDAKFQAIGCAGAHAAGSAITEMIKDMTLKQAEQLKEKDIIIHLNGIPETKVHCTRLALITLNEAIQKYKNF
jgi:nitrogen fixation NifU-like protein